MDRFIADLPATPDGDLTLCLEDGIAYQTDMTITAAYDESYFDKCAGYEGQDIAQKINAGRVALVNRHVGTGNVVDIGIGSGEFIRNRPFTWGHDVNPKAMRWLVERRLWTDELHSFAGYTFWDVIEHIPEPEGYFRQIAPGSCLFTSIPIFQSLRKVRESRHYRPGEHLYYFTDGGFIQWMKRHGFGLLEKQDFETEAGRDSIRSYAFIKEMTSPRKIDSL